MKYRISSYQKSGSLWFANGGSLLITEKEYIVRGFFRTVARFDIEKTVASRIPALLFLDKGIRLDDGEKSIDLYFFFKTAEKVSRTLGI